MRTGVLLKRVDLRPVTDPLSGEVRGDPHGGMSAADRCALELALRTGGEVTAVSAGTDAARDVLREALAAGAHRAIWVELDPDASSAAVAAAVAPLLADCAFVWAGDYSLDRGSGSVPAFVAAELDVAQALGLSAVETEAAGVGPLPVRRRLDGGRQELLEVAAPAVLSVEAGLVPPRRPGLGAVLAAQQAPIEHRIAAAGPIPRGKSAAYRPRARVLAGPDVRQSARERLVQMSGALTVHDPPRVVHGEAAEAADELFAFLRSRGYLS
ncbi:MAG TPA: mycofactocin-associated electron transfer flavoprotein beta subunit [Mycobacteriales bacterium]|nr:mycofactocin-associated electron transfer flavoprotein beta subunit [Mycobacteriales bacterium]